MCDKLAHFTDHVKVKLRQSPGEDPYLVALPKDMRQCNGGATIAKHAKALLSPCSETNRKLSYSILVLYLQGRVRGQFLHGWNE